MFGLAACRSGSLKHVAFASYGHINALKVASEGGAIYIRRGARGMMRGTVTLRAMARPPQHMGSRGL